MRVAALYDIHGNLPALEAVLAEVEAAAPDLVVVGGDVVAGALPARDARAPRRPGRPGPLGDGQRRPHGHRGLRPRRPPGRPRGRDRPPRRLGRAAAHAGAARPARRVRAARAGRRRRPRPGALLPRLTAQRRGDPHRGQLRRAARADPRRRRRGGRGLRPHAPPVRPPRPRDSPPQRGQRGHALRGPSRGLLALARPGAGAAPDRLRHRRGGRADASRPARPTLEEQVLRESLLEPVGAAYVARHFEDRATA